MVNSRIVAVAVAGQGQRQSMAVGLVGPAK